MHKLVLNGAPRDAAERADGDLLLAHALEADVRVAPGARSDLDLAFEAAVLRVHQPEVDAGIASKIEQSATDVLAQLRRVVVLEVERNHVPEKEFDGLSKFKEEG